MHLHNIIVRSVILISLIFLSLGCRHSSTETTLTPSAASALTQTPVLTTTSVRTATPVRTRVTPTATPTPITGQIGWIVIPSVELEEPIVKVSWHIEQLDGISVAVWDADDAYVSYLIGSAALGDQGNCVLAGHSGGTESSPFAQLEALQEGDEIILRDMSGTETSYTVTGSVRIQQSGLEVGEQIEAAEVLDATEDTRLTLVTCWPEWGYTHRLIVTAVVGNK